MEEWKSISGYDGLYLISDEGNVKSVRTNKVLTPRHNKDGYLIISLHKDGHRVTTTIAKLVGLHFVKGQTKNNNQIIYLDGNRDNVLATNLAWSSTFKNNQNDVLKNIMLSTRIMATNEETGEQQIFENMGDASAFLGEKPYFVRDKMRKKIIRKNVNGYTLERI